MLQKDALELIQKTAVAAADAKIVKVPGDERAGFVAHNGTLTPVDFPPAARNHRLESLDDLVQLALSSDTLADVKGAEGRSAPRIVSVWHSESQVVVVFDDDDRRDLARLPLNTSSVFDLVKEWGDEECAFDQKQFLSLLRIDLAGTVSESDAMLFSTALRNMRFRTEDNQGAEYGKANQGLSRSIENECVGADKLPEVLKITTKVYRGLAELHPVLLNVAVTIDYTQKKFVLRPIADAIPDALEATQLELRALLDKKLADADRVSVYYGSP